MSGDSYKSSSPSFSTSSSDELMSSTCFTTNLFSIFENGLFLSTVRSSRSSLSSLMLKIEINSSFKFFTTSERLLLRFVISTSDYPMRFSEISIFSLS